MTEPPPPSIVLIVFDSLSEDAITSMENELPVLSGLRQSGVSFAGAYAPSPEGGPARASLFTGLDMGAHGVWTDGVALPERETTVSQRLTSCGYRTWLVGRRHLAGMSHWTTEHSRPCEFSHLEWAHGPLHRSRQNAYLTWLQETAPKTYHEIFPKQADPDDTEIPDWQRAAIADLPDRLSFNSWVGARACDLLSRPSGAGPSFGIAAFVVGKTMGAAPDPQTPCERLNARALQQADAAIGNILRSVEDQGMSDNTAVVVTAARGSVDDAPEQLVQESAIKVPLLIRTPGGEARSVQPMVSTIDVAPTLYELAGVSPPPRLQGRSLLAGGTDDGLRGWALSRLRSPDHGWKSALRKDQWKLVMTHGRPDEGAAPDFSLFDLRADPSETRDLSGSHAHQAELERMIDLMIDARVALEDRTEPRIASF